MYKVILGIISGLLILALFTSNQNQTLEEAGNSFDYTSKCY